jgi:ATP-binding protein involved in chromosome partitioning
MNESGVREFLSGLSVPGVEGDLISAGHLVEVEFDDDGLILVLKLDGFNRDQRHGIEDAVLKAFETQSDIGDVSIEIETDEVPAPPPAAPSGAPDSGLTMHGSGGGQSVTPPENALSGVKNIIGVASGKGGVGKSTISANLAMALKARGARVGLCDIDIYGPSIPIQMGVAEAKPAVSEDQKKFLPVDAYGVKVMSIGFLVDEDTPVIWRGPIVGSVVKQFLEDVVWGELDYLVIDMPPGTGDAQLTLTQTAPITGAVVVTTPSELALVDAKKGLQMFRKVDVPVLGLVENMSHYVCESCGHHSQPFSSGGTDRMAETMGVDVLTHVPLDVEIQRGSDSGRPVVDAAPESPQTEAFMKLADAVIEKCPMAKAGSEKKGLLSGLFRR